MISGFFSNAVKKHAILIASGVLILAACEPSKSDALNEDTAKTLAVTGVGEIEVMPDEFVISGAVIKQDDEIGEAMNAVAEVINKVQATIPEIDGLESSDFNFATVNSTGVKDPECLLFNQDAARTNSSLREGEKRVAQKLCKDVTQQASVTFTLTGGPAELTGNAISKLSEAGAVRVQLNGYRVSNIEEIELKAGEQAVSNARDKADRLTAAAGAKVLGVKNLNSYVPTYSQRNASAPRVSTSGAGETARILNDDGETQSVTEMNLTPGPQVISASIQLEFIYE